MIHLSPAAVREIKRLQSKCQNKDAQFRLSVEVGGCSGLYYTLAFEQEVKPDDRLFESNSIAVVVDTQSLSYINGTTLDYSEDLMGGAFRFHNPNAEQSCGCGHSFSIKQA